MKSSNSKNNARMESYEKKFQNTWQRFPSRFKSIQVFTLEFGEIKKRLKYLKINKELE